MESSLVTKGGSESVAGTRLFANVRFYLSGNVDAKVIKSLEDGGAERNNYFSDFVTHCILGDSFNEADISDAKDLYEVPAVVQDWVTFSVICNTLLPTEAFGGGDQHLFSDVAVCVSQISHIDCKVLWTLVTYNGGKFDLVLNKATTHLVTGKAQGAKYEYISARNIAVKVVTPDWIIDCITNKTICDETLYHPRLLITSSVSTPCPSVADTSVNSELSTTRITGFEDLDSIAADQMEIFKDNVDLEQLKQRLPWNQSISNMDSVFTDIQSHLLLPKEENTSQGNMLVQVELKPSSSVPVDQAVPVPVSSQLQQQQQEQQPQILQQQQSIYLQNQQQQQQPNQTPFSSSSIVNPGPLPSPVTSFLSSIIPNVPSATLQTSAPSFPSPTMPTAQQLQQTSGQSQTSAMTQLLQSQSPGPNRMQQFNLPLNQTQVSASGGYVATSQMTSQQQQILQHQQSLNQPQQVVQHPLILQQQQQQQQKQQQMLQQQLVTHPQQPLSQNQQAVILQKRMLQHQQQRLLLQQQQQQQQQLLQQGGNTAHWRPAVPQQHPQQTGQPVQQQLQSANQFANTSSNTVNNQAAWQQQQQQQQTQQVQQQSPQQLQHVRVRQGERRSIIGTWSQQMPGQPRVQEETIHLDAKTHQRLQVMPMNERIAFLNKLKLQRQLLQQQQQPQNPQQLQQKHVIRQPLQNTQTVIRAVAASQIMPQGLNQQQQMQWLQQHHPQLRQQQLLIQQQGVDRTQGLVSVKGNVIQQSPTNQGQLQQSMQQPQPQQQQVINTVLQNTASPAASPNRPVASASPQHLVQLQQQRQQHLQRLQALQESQKQQQQQVMQQQVAVSNPNALYSPQQVSPNQIQQQQGQPMQQSQQPLIVNPKTKTALANMLSGRLQGGINSPQHQAPQILSAQQEVSAAGQLRMMTAQHHAAQRMQSIPPPPPPPSPAPQQQQQQFQRAALNNVTNSAASASAMQSRGGRAVAAAIGMLKSQQAYSHSASRVVAALAKCAAGQAGHAGHVPPPAPPPPQPRFFGHTPGVQVPPDKCLLSCVFLIVEYDRHPEFCDKVEKWKKVIEENGGEIETLYSLRVTHILCLTQKHPLVQQGLRDGKRCVTADWLSDILLKQQLLPPFYALHFPTPFSDERPCRHFIMSLTGFKGEERNRVKYMIELTGAKVTSYFSSDNNFLICRRPEGRKVKKARELGKSVVNVLWLNEVLFGHFTCLYQPENPKYQQFNLNSPFRIEYNLVPHLMLAWKVPVSVTPDAFERASLSPSHGVKRKRHPYYNTSSTSFSDFDQESLDSLLIDVPITTLTPPHPGNRPVVLFSGFVNPISEQKVVKQLGGALAKSCRDATHLVMSQPQRTYKFLCCISTCKYIVNLDWLKDSQACNTFVDETPYVIEVIEMEDHATKCYVSKVLRSNERSQLFKNKIFYITPGVVPAPSALREIIECAGGTVEKQRRSLRNILDMLPNTYFAITCRGDLHLVADLIQGDCGAYSAEFVLTAVMTQNLQYDCVYKRNKSTRQRSGLN